jgi:hypothetical protein
MQCTDQNLLRSLYDMWTSQYVRWRTFAEGPSTESIDGPVGAASRLWEPDNQLARVLGQRRDTPGNEKWSGRWESNPRGRQFRILKTSGFVRWRMPSVISV